MAANNWRTKPASSLPIPTDGRRGLQTDNAPINFEQYTDDAIEKFIIWKYKWHGLARLIDAILGVCGFTTYVNPLEPDKGVNILAAPDSMGFGNPRICVQVKFMNRQWVDQTPDQLVDAMQYHQANQELLVSWGVQGQHRQEASGPIL